MIESGRRDPQKLVCLARLERALNALSTRSLCQLGYRHTEDQAGFEPALGFSQRIKSPPRSAATVTGPNSILANPGGFDPLADGLKGRSLSIRVRGSGSIGELVRMAGIEPA